MGTVLRHRLQWAVAASTVVMADMAEDQTALELNTALTDDLLLLVLRCLGPHDLHRSAAPVCKRW